jgi:dimethylamine corrinoid protein
LNGEISPLNEIGSAFLSLDYSLVKDLVKKALESRVPPEDILNAMQDGIAEVGRKYESGEYFLSELMAAGEIMEVGLAELRPHLKTGGLGKAGVVVIGTVKGDLHDLGKNLVKGLLQSSGFTVHDLGTDVSKEAFIEKVREVNPDILGISGLLTLSMPEMAAVVKGLEMAGLRKKVKVIIGGNMVTEEFSREIGADAATRNAVTGVRICKEWVKR